MVRRVGKYDERLWALNRWHRANLEKHPDAYGMADWHRAELEALLPESERVAWHRAELKRLDPQYRMQTIYFNLAVAEDDARARGLEPGDPEFPTIFDFDPIPELRLS